MILKRQTINQFYRQQYKPFHGIGHICFNPHKDLCYTSIPMYYIENHRGVINYVFSKINWQTEQITYNIDLIKKPLKIGIPLKKVADSVILSFMKLKLTDLFQHNQESRIVYFKDFDFSFKDLHDQLNAYCVWQLSSVFKSIRKLHKH